MCSRVSAYAIALIGVSTASLAQHNGEGASTLEEVVVTAQKRAASLQDVPFSITAPSEQQIRNSGASNIVELARNVAGLAIADLGPGQSQVAIRGVSSGQVVRDESSRKETVGVYLDESVISVALFTPDLELFDLERVEVLRGPQGTLFGSGSLGGTIRYITRAPNVQRTEGAIEVSAATIDGGDQTYNLRGMVNAPLADDRVAVRAVGYYNEIGGFIDALTPSGRIAQNVNGGEKYGGRLSLRFEPIDGLDVTPRFVYQKLAVDGFPRADVFNLFCNPYTTTRPACSFKDTQQFRQTDEGLEDEFRLADLTANWELGEVTLTSVSSYTNRDIAVLRDSTQLVGQINAVAIGVPELATLDSTLLDATTLEAFSQELRLASSSAGPLQWVVGAYYIDQDKTYLQRNDVPGFEAGFNDLVGPPGIDTSDLLAPLGTDTDVIVGSSFDIRLTQSALFGELSYAFTDRLTGSAGLRWYDYEEERHAILSGFYNGGPTPPELRQRTSEDDGFTPRLMLSYALNDGVKLNAQAAKGFRLGGINDPLLTTICQPDIGALGGTDIERFGSEEVWNYEVGVKSRIGNRATLNAAAYYVDITDLQVSVRLPCSSTIILNVPESVSRGAEAELTVKVTQSLELGASIAYNDAEVRQGVALVDIRRGDRLPTSPRLQASTSAFYSMPIGSGGLEAFAGAVVQYQSDSISFLLDQRNGGTLPFTVTYGRQPGDGAPVAYPTELDAYTIANLRFGVRTSDQWEIALFVNNVTDESAQLALDRERGGEGRVAYLRNQPRTIGVTARKAF